MTPNATLTPDRNRLADVPLPEDTARRLKRAGENHRKWIEQRNEMITLAYEQGGGVREIGRLVGLSHVQILNILRDAGVRTAPVGHNPRLKRDGTPVDDAGVEPTS